MDLSFIVDGLPPKQAHKCTAQKSSSSSCPVPQEHSRLIKSPQQSPLKDTIPRAAMLLVPALTPCFVEYPENVCCTHQAQRPGSFLPVSEVQRSPIEHSLTSPQMGANIGYLHSIPVLTHMDSAFPPNSAPCPSKSSFHGAPPSHATVPLKVPSPYPAYERAQSSSPVFISGADNRKRSYHSSQSNDYCSHERAPEVKMRKMDTRVYSSPAPSTYALRRERGSRANHNHQANGGKLQGSQNLNEHIIVLDSAGNHRNQVNTKSRQYICQDCGRSFFRKSDLVRHLQIHLDIKPNICEVCGKKFIQRSALTVHHRVHTGEKPYSCPVCARAFGDSSSLARHRRIHYRESDTRPSGTERSYSRKQFESPMTGTAEN